GHDVQPGRPRVGRSRQINMRLVAWSLIAVTLLSPALFGWHQWQVRRHAPLLFDPGPLRCNKGAWDNPSGTLYLYLQIRPDDAEALLLRAQAADKLMTEPGQLARRVSLYYAAVQANPARQDARLRLSELLFDTRRFDQAIVQARQVSSPPADQ